MASTAETLDFTPRRGKARLRTGIPAALITIKGRQEISLVDLSETGAGILVRDPEPIAGGILKWMDYEVYGTVVRRVGDDVGLLFDEPIDLDWVLETRAWLPMLADGRIELRRFARDWVKGRPPPVERARISDMPAPKYGAGRPRAAAADWLRVGVPFVLAGALFGVIVGLASAMF